MAEVKWIKIVTDVFNDEKILLIESLPECDSIIVIWFKLLCLAGKNNNCGVFTLNNKIPYTEEMFATIFRRPLNIVRLALKTFQEFGMIEIENNTVIIPNWEKHQSLESFEMAREQTRKRVQKHREKQKQIAQNDCNVTVTQDVTLQYENVTQTDKIRLDKIRLEEDKDIILQDKPAKTPKVKYGEFQNVLLTDEEYQKLQDKFSDYQAKIENLSSYIASKGKKYTSHYATILTWARAEKSKEESKWNPL